jgi:hypothetical protein
MLFCFDSHYYRPLYFNHPPNSSIQYNMFPFLPLVPFQIPGDKVCVCVYASTEQNNMSCTGVKPNQTPASQEREPCSSSSRNLL